jgi:hypothetical protein
VDESLLLGIGRHMVPIPRSVWQSQVSGDADLGFMSEDHHRIRNWVVMELPRVGKPLSPDSIARELDLSLDRVVGILDDLEKHMTFLFRDEQGAVEWAYPVTVAHTPHHIAFGSGERVNAA